MGQACRLYGRWERCVQDFYGKPEEKRTLGRPRHRWEDNMEMSLKRSWMGSLIGSG